MLADIREPVLPFGLSDVHGEGRQIACRYQALSSALNLRLRRQARRLGVSLASLCHLAWAQVLASVSGRDAVVFGTVLLGRLQGGEGAERALGLFINTLPLRLDIDRRGVETAAREAHVRLSGLLAHEHAPLALAQRCSGVSPGAPLFSALLNYRHNNGEAVALPEGVSLLSAEERTNYPFVLSVEDGGDSLGVTAQVTETVDAQRVCDYMVQALSSWRKRWSRRRRRRCVHWRWCRRRNANCCCMAGTAPSVTTRWIRRWRRCSSSRCAARRTPPRW